MKVYTVGGCVRDIILGITPNDIDYVVVGATPQQMLNNGLTQVGADFPVFLDDRGDEYALARTERKTNPGYKGFETTFDPSITLEDDLKRRDLTVNSLAVLKTDWTEFTKTKDLSLVIDPFGGIADIKSKVLRHTSDHFKEDPVRILRIARFHAKYQFDIANDTMDLMRTMVSDGEVNHLVPERVWAEMKKAIMLPNAILFFWALHKCGALNILFPNMSNNLTINGISIRAATLRNHSFIVRCMLLFGFLENGTEVLTNCKAPNDIITSVLHFHRWILLSRITTRSIDILDFIKLIKAERSPDTLYDISLALNVILSYDDCARFDRIIKATDIIRNITFASLTHEQQMSLQGSAIGDAIDALKVSAINDINK